ncbi:MAG: ectoine hydroxylase-related dioxygenase (phytanoyl-CoA dioxygenase family) [Planctomycetota bacterium]
MNSPPPPSDTPDPARFLRDPSALALPWIESPFFEELLAAQDLTSEERAIARSYRDNGYAVIEDCFEPELIDAITAQYDWLFDPSTKFQLPYWAEDVLDADRSRRQDAWCVCAPVKELATHPKMLRILQVLYGRAAIPFQTLNFQHGTEQSLHSDAFHFSSIPARFMTGVWVALEDITESNGPLRYVPGSHKLPDVQLADFGLWSQSPEGGLGHNYQVFEAYVKAALDKYDMPVEQLTCKKGSAVIWASHLLHGGSPILDSTSTRLSQVTHYYFEDCVYYTPAYSDTPIGELFLRKVHDIRTGEQVPQIYNGSPMRVFSSNGERSRITASHGNKWEGPLPSGRRLDKLRRAVLRITRRIEKAWGR